MLLECPEPQPELELMALCINLATNKRNAQVICEGKEMLLLTKSLRLAFCLIQRCYRSRLATSDETCFQI